MSRVVERHFLTVPRGCLQFVIVVFPDHTHLLFFLGNLTDLCLTSKWFLMISGNPSSKSLAPDQTDV